MPKIIVKEYDNTTAGEAEYSNFTVAIPGYVVNTTAFTKVADDNGIYECSSKKDFINNIGKYNYAEGVEAIAPTLSKEETQLGLNEIHEFEGTIYSYQENETGEIGRLRDTKYVYTLVTNKIRAEWNATTYYTRTGEEGAYVYTVVDKEAIPNPVYGTSYYIRKGETEPYEYEEVNNDIFKSADKYAVILAGNEGKDGVTGEDLHLGNRMAYELVKLGYTILYKQLIPGQEDVLADYDVAAPYWECLKDKSNYDFRYICTGGYTKRTKQTDGTYIYDVATTCKAFHAISDISEYRNNQDTLDEESKTGRGDCIALMDIVEQSAWKVLSQEAVIKSIRSQINESFSFLSTNGVGKFSAIFAPKVNYALEADTGFGDVTETGYKDIAFPGSFHYLTCAAKAFENFAEWYAVAGYVRGICDYKINGTTLKLGEIAVNALEPRTIKTFDSKEFKHAVNVITNIRGNIYTWGNRTAHALNNDGLIASHFLNVRQLCCTLKKQIYVACKALTFNPNSDLLWIDFCNAIRPTLEKMKADQGIEDYKFIKVRSTKKALMTAKIKIVPIEAVEDFDISVYLEDSISGTTVAVEE